MNDGLSAFPSPMVQGWSEGSPGMTLRDWFAGQALAGVLSTCAHPDSTGPVGLDPVAYAVLAHQIADAMLAERAKVQS